MMPSTVKVLIPSGVSVGSATFSIAAGHSYTIMDFFINTLPMIQWIAAALAGVSGAIAIGTVFYHWIQHKPK